MEDMEVHDQYSFECIPKAVVIQRRRRVLAVMILMMAIPMPLFEERTTRMRICKGV